MKKTIMIVSTIVFTTFAFAQNTYKLDKNHARLSFSVKHMGISFVDGNFKTFDATVVSSKKDYSDAKIELTADIKSINTEVEMRDNDLRSPNWFDAEKYPTLTFKSTAFKKASESQFKLIGDITIHGVTKPISFDVVYNGMIQNPFSKKYTCGFTITGKLNRSDFGIGNESIPTVGKEVELKSNVEFVVN
jgi:polyisoprenoid-binding protein YceI